MTFWVLIVYSILSKTIPSGIPWSIISFYTLQTMFKGLVLFVPSTCNLSIFCIALMVFYIHAHCPNNLSKFSPIFLWLLKCIVHFYFLYFYQYLVNIRDKFHFRLSVSDSEYRFVIKCIQQSKHYSGYHTIQISTWDKICGCLCTICHSLSHYMFHVLRMSTKSSQNKIHFSSQ